MTDTLPNVILEKGIWIDVYDIPGLNIPVGTKVRVQNLTTSHVRAISSATQPPARPAGFNTIPPFNYGFNDEGDEGAWLYSSVGGAVNVTVVVE